MVVLHIITGLNDGGAEGVLYRLCRHDTEHHHVVVSLMDNGKYGPLLEDAGTKVYCLGMKRGRFTSGALLRLWRLLREMRPDVVQTWMYHPDLIGGVVARFLGLSAVCWGIRNSTFEPGSTPIGTVMVARVCALLSRWVPRIIISCSEESVRVHETIGYISGKIIVIPNGYDLSSFAPDPFARERLRGQWDIDEDMTLIGMVARYDLQKDHFNLISALSQLAHAGYRFRVVLAGTGMDDENGRLTSAIKAAGLQRDIRLLGQRDDVPAIMNALDLHVLSSSGEAFPNVLAEAMACGTPCVSTDVGDAALIIGHAGWLVPPRNAGALAGALGEAIMARNDSTNWQKRRIAARKHIELHFGIEKMVRSYGAVWKRVQRAHFGKNVNAGGCYGDFP